MRSMVVGASDQRFASLQTPSAPSPPLPPRVGRTAYRNAGQVALPGAPPASTKEAPVFNW